MLRRPGRLVVLVVVVAVAATVAYLLLPPRQAGDVAVPPPDATPEQVVAAYVAALDAHDCDTAAALSVEGAEESARAWCEDVAGLRDVVVREHFTERARDTRHSVPEVANVPVTFDLDWRPLHDDGSMAEGPTTWGYRLVRDPADSSWRVFDQGTG